MMVFPPGLESVADPVTMSFPIPRAAPGAAIPRGGLIYIGVPMAHAVNRTDAPVTYDPFAHPFELPVSE